MHIGVLPTSKTLHGQVNNHMKRPRSQDPNGITISGGDTPPLHRPTSPASGRLSLGVGNTALLSHTLHFFL